MSTHRWITEMIEWARKRIHSHPDESEVALFLERVEQLIQRGKEIDALPSEEVVAHANAVQALEQRHDQELYDLRERSRSKERDRLSSSDDLAQYERGINDLLERQMVEHRKLCEPWEHIETLSNGTLQADEELMGSLDDQFEELLERFGSCERA